MFVALALAACAVQETVAASPAEDVRALFAQAADAAGLSLEDLVQDQKLLERAFNDFQAGKISEEQLKQLVRNCNRRHSQYQWKYEKKLVREYTQGDRT